MLTDGNWVISGASDADVLACGHSHVIAMEWALREGVAADGLSAAVCYARDAHLQSLGSSEYWDFVVESAPSRTVAVVWNGNQHNADFLIEPRPPVRVAGSQQVEWSPGVAWIPQEMVRARWRPTNDDLEEVLQRLTRVARRVLVLGTPPPKADALVAEALQTEPHFVSVARQLGFEPGCAPVTPGPTRRVLWSIVQDMLAESAAATGAIFVPVPDAALDDIGYLRSELTVPDATHANTAYAQLMWRAVADVVVGSAA